MNLYIYLIALVCSICLSNMDQDKIIDQRITLITLGVQDLKVSEHFYSDILGWKKTGQSTDAIVFYQLQSMQLCLYPSDLLMEDAHSKTDKNGFPGFTFSHYVQDDIEVNRILSNLEAHGATVTVPPSRTSWGGYRGYFVDPDGFQWEVVHNPYDDSWQEY